MRQQEIISLIEKERVKRGLSFRQLGKMADLSHATYQSAIKLDRGMTWDSICKILIALGFKLKVVVK